MPTTRTRAAVVESAGAGFGLGEVSLDELRPDEIRVRIVAAGVCHTDLGVAAGALPFPLPGVLGHEGAGVVEETGTAVTRVAAGDRVLLSYTSCGRCAHCRDGHPAYCETWLPANLTGGRRPDGTSPISRDGTPLGGHFFGQSSFAGHAVVDERSVVETTGNVDVLRTAIGTLAACGTAVVVGAPAFGTEVPVDVNFLLRGRHVVGLTMGDAETQALVPTLAELVTTGRFPLAKLVTHYEFGQIGQAVEDMVSGKTIKPVLRL
jgi:aryl-alcohol dehydrogenase